MANNAHVKRHEELMEKTAGKVRVMTQDERKQKAKASRGLLLQDAAVNGSSSRASSANSSSIGNAV